MQKILLLVLIYTSPLFASDIFHLNPVMSLPGFSFDINGKPVTNWPVGNGATEASKTYAQGGYLVSLNYDKQKNPRMLSYSATNTDSSGRAENKEFIALLDSKGNSQFIFQRENGSSFAVSTAYCNRVYREMGVKSNHDLVSKVLECSKVLSFTLNESEIGEAQKTVKAYSEYESKSSRDPIPGLGIVTGFLRSRQIEIKAKETRKAGEDYARDVMKLVKLCEIIAPKLVENPTTLKAEDIGRE